MSLGETLLRPTAMLYRNLASMDAEESIRANPLDGVVLLGRLRQDHAGAADGRGQRRHPDDLRLRRPDALRQVPRPATSARAPTSWSMSEDLRAGKITLEDFHEAEVVHAPLARPLHDDGHRVDDGLDGRGARRRPAGQRGDIRRSTRGAMCSPGWPGGASWSW